MTSIRAGSPIRVETPDLSQEPERLDCIRALRIVESPSLNGYTTLVESVALFFRVPVAFFSVVGETRQFIKASVGLDLEETSRADSFCKRTILKRGIYSVADASKDPDYASNPFVWSPPHIRFYAGAPVVIERRHAIGSLCIVDHRPREFDEAQRRMLWHFSVMLAGVIEIQQLDLAKPKILPPSAPRVQNG